MDLSPDSGEDIELDDVYRKSDPFKFLPEVYNSGSDLRRQSHEFYDQIVEVYGINAAPSICRGLVPAAAMYTHATVLYADIVGFTTHCTTKGLDEISGWMTRVHKKIDQLLDKYAIRKVETRGDCCICVSGTNFISTTESVSKDLASDQVTRMLKFGVEMSIELQTGERTEVRVGMATGSIVLTHISHIADTLPAKYIYGDTVNVAARMEQTGASGMIQLNELAAMTYAEEQNLDQADVPLEVKEIKGKGVMRVAMYDCSKTGFVLHEHISNAR